MNIYPQRSPYTHRDSQCLQRGRLVHRYRRRKTDCSSLFIVPATSAAQNRLLFFFFLLRPFTVLMKKTRAIKQSIIYRCLWVSYSALFPVLVGWHARAVSLPPRRCHFGMASLPPELHHFWFTSGILTYLTTNIGESQHALPGHCMH